MTFIPRVLPTAYLPNVTGSIAKRNEVADKLSNDFGKWLLWQSLQGKKQLSAKDMQDYYKQTYPNINIAIEDKKSSTNLANFSPKISIDKDNIACIKGHILNAPILKFKNNLNLTRTFHCLYHENDHLSDFLVNPKKTAREIEKHNIFGICKLIMLEFGNFYKKHLYLNKDVTENTNLDNLKKDIKKFFKWRFFSSNQKINTLQSWRYGLSSEDRAYNRTADFLMKNIEPEGVDTGLDRKEIYKKEGVFDFEKRLYPQKIQILNELLAEEIKDHRAKHAAKLRKRKRLKAGV